MSNVFALPKPNNILRMEAEAHLRMKARMQLACACTELQASDASVEVVLDHVANMMQFLDELVAIKQACK